MGEKRWTDEEMVEQASQMILKELTELLERDVMEKMVGPRVRRAAGRKRKVAGSGVGGTAGSLGGVKGRGEGEGEGIVGQAAAFGKTLKGLSFKKQPKRVREEVKVVEPELEPEQDQEVQAQEQAEGASEAGKVGEPEQAEVDRPQKKMKVDGEEEATKRVGEEEERRPAEEDIESEDETPAPSTLSIPVSTPATTPAMVETVTPEEPRKRASSIDRDETEEPAKKKAKMDVDVALAANTKVEKKAKKGAKKVRPSVAIQEPVEQVIIPEPLEFTAPAVAQITPASSLSPPSSPLHSPISAPPKVELPLEPLKLGLCDDDEDLYFVRLALAEDMGIDLPDRHPPVPPEPDPDAPPPFRVHVTGSARTEGYYKISHAEKSAYVAQYASRSSATDAIEDNNQPHQPKQTMTSSRSNRANARRQAQGLEEINQVQRAMALSKGETAAAELTIKFNQLQSRKKHLRFARSPIHDWGLYAMERISKGEMVIEYVGEVIRAQIADKREKAYERQGIGSSYLFRIDEDLVVDATKKGNLGYVVLSLVTRGLGWRGLTRAVN